jgi:glycosyltransferase involved in cell wall biosynthesis
VRRRRILYLIDRAVDSGGAERFAVGLATHLPRERFDVWMCSTRLTEPSVGAAFDAAGVRHIDLGREARLELHRFRGLAQLMRREHFEIVHSHSFGSNLWGTLFGRTYGVPVIIAHEHNWSYSGEHARVWVDRNLIGRLATRFIAVSEAQRDLMVSVEKIPPEKIVVLPTGYIPSRLSPATDLRSELGLHLDTPVVGTAAIMRAEKALDVLIQAHAEVTRRMPDAHLVIAGVGECEDELRRCASELAIADRVHFLGRRLDVDALLASFDVGALSSDWEGMPLFVFECMAAGIPLVATSVGGVPEVVKHGETGLLVGPRDPAALADAILSLLSDPNRREQLADAAAQRLGEFTIGAIAERFADLYEQLLSAPATAVDHVALGG